MAGQCLGRGLEYDRVKLDILQDASTIDLAPEELRYRSKYTKLNRTEANSECMSVCPSHTAPRTPTPPLPNPTEGTSPPPGRSRITCYV